jgi:hypothetical protein
MREDAGLLNGIDSQDLMDTYIRRDVAAHILHNTLFAPNVQYIYNAAGIVQQVSRIVGTDGQYVTLAKIYLGLNVLVGVAERNDWAGVATTGINASLQTGMHSAFDIRSIDGLITGSYAVGPVQFPDTFPVELLGHEVRIYARTKVSPTATSVGVYDKIYGTPVKTARSFEANKYAVANVTDDDWGPDTNSTIGYYHRDHGGEGVNTDADNVKDAKIFGNYKPGIANNNAIAIGSPINFIDNNADGKYEYVIAYSVWYSKVTVVGTDADTKITAISGDGGGFDGIHSLNAVPKANIWNAGDVKVDDRALVYKIGDRYGLINIPETQAILTAAKENSTVAVISDSEYRNTSLESRVTTVGDLFFAGNFNTEKGYRFWKNWILEGPETVGSDSVWALVLDSYIHSNGIGSYAKSVKLLLEDGTQGTYDLGDIKETASGDGYGVAINTARIDKIALSHSGGPLDGAVLYPEAGIVVKAEVAADGKSVTLYDGVSGTGASLVTATVTDTTNGTPSGSTPLDSAIGGWSKDNALFTFPGEMEATDADEDRQGVVLSSSVFFAVKLWDPNDPGFTAADIGKIGRFKSASVFKGRSMESFDAQYVGTYVLGDDGAYSGAGASGDDIVAYPTIDPGTTANFNLGGTTGVVPLNSELSATPVIDTNNDIAYRVIQDVTRTATDQAGSISGANAYQQPIVAASVVGARVKTITKSVGKYAYVIDEPYVDYTSGVGYVGHLYMFDGTEAKAYKTAPGIRAKNNPSWAVGDIDSPLDGLVINGTSHNLGIRGGDVIQYLTNADGDLSSIVNVFKYNGNNAFGTAPAVNFSDVPNDSNAEMGNAYDGYQSRLDDYYLTMYQTSDTNLTVDYLFGVTGDTKYYAIDTANKTGTAVTNSSMTHGNETNAYRTILVTQGSNGAYPTAVAVFQLVGDIRHPKDEQAAVVIPQTPASFSLVVGSDATDLTVAAVGESGGDSYELVAWSRNSSANKPSNNSGDGFLNNRTVPFNGAPTTFTDMAAVQGISAGDGLWFGFRKAGTNEDLEWKYVRVVDSAVAAALEPSAVNAAANKVAGVDITPVAAENIGQNGGEVTLKVAGTGTGTASSSEFEGEWGGSGGSAAPAGTVGLYVDVTDILTDAYGLAAIDQIQIIATNPYNSSTASVLSDPSITNAGVKYTQGSVTTHGVWGLAVMPGTTITLKFYKDATIDTSGGANNYTLSGGTYLFTVTINATGLTVT